MLDDVTRRIFVREASHLAPVLYEHFDAAIIATKRLTIAEEKYPHAHALHRRGVFRDGLGGYTLPGGWTVGGNPRRTGQTILENAGLGARLRILSESTVTADGVPHAGSNYARRAAWRTLALFDDDIVADRNMLLLTNARAATPALRIVHPTEPGHYKGRVSCDFSVTMLREVDVMGDVSFDTSEDYEDFFVHLENEEGGDA